MSKASLTIGDIVSVETNNNKTEWMTVVARAISSTQPIPKFIVQDSAGRRHKIVKHNFSSKGWMINNKVE